MYIFYVSNDDFPDVEHLAEELSDDDHRVQWRNPYKFGDSKEVAGAAKVFVYGKHEQVLAACKQHGVPLVHVTYDGDKVQADLSESKTPSMDWTKDELQAYAEANGVEINSGDTKADILEKIDEAHNR